MILLSRIYVFPWFSHFPLPRPMATHDPFARSSDKGTANDTTDATATAEGDAGDAGDAGDERRATKRARQSSKRKVRNGRGTGRGMGLLGWAESRESGNPLGIDPEIHVRLGILTCQRMSSVWGYSKNCGKHGDIMFKHYNKWYKWMFFGSIERFRCFINSILIISWWNVRRYWAATTSRKVLSDLW